MAEKAPWPDSTAEEDASYALAKQLWDMEFEGEVVSQAGPQSAEYVDADRARALPVGNYNVQGLYRGPDVESITETERYAPIADALAKRGIEPPGPDTASAVGMSNANTQIWGHEFGHRRDEFEGGGGERRRLVHDAFRSDTPFEWAAAVNRWYAFNKRRFQKDDTINNYKDIEAHLKKTIESNLDSLINVEVEAREGEGDVPIKREGFFNRETLDKDQREEATRRSHSWSIDKYNELIENMEVKKASGGKVTMPSKSPEQAALMRAVAHGWKKPGGGGPSQSVAREFTNADKGYAEGGPVKGVSFKQMVKQLGGGLGGMFKLMRGLESGGYYKDENTGLIYPPEPTILAPDSGAGPATTPGYDPYYGGSGGGSRGPRGRGGRGGGGGRGRNGGGGDYQPPPPRIIPGNPPVVPPGRDDTGGLVDGTGGLGQVASPDAGRESDYSREAAAHQARIRAILGTGNARGGRVGYEEGGVVRPGHAEGANPYEDGTARYKMWERKHHADPAPPPPPPPPPEEKGWFESLFSGAEDLGTRTERELEEMEQARGGRVNYAAGGLAAMSGRQQMRGGKPMPDPRSMPPMPPRGGMPPQRRPMDPRMSGPKPGMPPGRGAPPMPMRPPARGGMGIPPQPTGRDEPPQIEGGPQIPPSLRGQMQAMRMQNRPRRGFSGPAGAGGPPGGSNRVGMQDQQGGLARALQKGTGRPPTSRRSAFPGR